MIKSKQVWLCILIILLGVTSFLCITHESSKFGGVSILSEGELQKKVKNLEYIKTPSNVDEILSFNSQKVAYDKNKNTFYVSQRTDSNDFSGVFATNYVNSSIYFETDEAFRDLKSAIEVGHEFNIWIITEQSYTICNIIITGMPVISINTENYVSDEFVKGEIMISNPKDEEVNGLSIKVANSMIKCNPNSETYSIKLLKKDYIEEKKLSLLGLEKKANWKLYKLSENDDTFMRALLASEVWNIINKDTILEREYELVEIIVNKRYKGLYLLAPKWTRGYLGLEQDNELIKVEEISQNYGKDILSNIELDSLCNYIMFLQITYAYKNAGEDYICADSSIQRKSSYLIAPDKIEYAFGDFENSLMYLNWNETSEMLILPEDIGIDELVWTQDIFMMCIDKWDDLQKRGINAEKLNCQVEKYRKQLIKSGIVARYEKVDYDYFCEQLKKYISERMEFLNTSVWVY